MAQVDFFGQAINSVPNDDELERLRRLAQQRGLGGNQATPNVPGGNNAAGGGDAGGGDAGGGGFEFPGASPEITARERAEPLIPGGLAAAFQQDVDEGWRDPADLPMARMIDAGYDSWKRSLEEYANEVGGRYQGEADDMARNLTYARNVGMDPAVFLEQAKAKILRGATNTPGGGDSGGFSFGSAGNPYAALGRPSGGGFGGPGIAPDTAQTIGQWLAQNPGDFGRAASALNIPQSAIDAYRAGNIGSGRVTTMGGGSDFNTTMPSPISLIENMFDDPATQQLEERIRAQLEALQQPIDDPERDSLVSQLQSVLANAQGGNPELEQLLASELSRLQNPVDDPDRAAYQEQLRNAQQMAQNNPQVARLMSLIDQQLGETPGYSQEELAILNTQAFEPIEALRQASQQRALQRASARGVLPSSGVVRSEQGDIDRDIDRMRMQANRDRAIQAIAERNRDLSRQIDLGQIAVNVPQRQQALSLGYGAQLADVAERARAEDEARQAAARGIGTTLYQDLPDRQESRATNAASALAQLQQAARMEQQGRDARALDLSSLLYQLPRTALQDALAVVGGSNPSAAASPFLSLLQQQQQQEYLERQQQAALWSQLGGIFAELFS